jgi:cobalt-zinc-cadmium efflux system protein
VISLTGYTRADSIASIAIFVLIVPRAWSLLREVVFVLLEATPRGVDLNEVRRHIEDVRGVVGVHDLHAWTITSGVPVLSATSLSTPPASPRAAPVKSLIGSANPSATIFDVDHYTFQLEPEGHQNHEAPSHH